jgi:histidine triad (HIT) family protein
MSSPKDCLFCKIAKGEVPASIVFQDEVCLAFMDIYPVTRGHCLLIPKKHFTNLLDVDLDVLSHLALRLAELTRKVQSGLKPEGILNAAANGPGAGQDIPHLHFHIIPRNKGDEFGFHFPKAYRDKMADRALLDKIAKTIREAK